MRPTARELPEFVRVGRGRRAALVHPDFVPQVSSALLDGQGLRPAGVRGRGELLRVTTPQGDILIREYLRGGMAARILRDTYLLDNRPLKELQVHLHAWRSGVPTVLPIGAMWQRSGIFFSGAYATLRADAEDLLHYLDAHPNPDSALLAACGRAVRAMHEAGICHADLQVKNILVSGGEALIIDFDGTRQIRVTPAMADRNLERLKRSFIKRGLPMVAFDAIELAYREL